MLDLGGTGIHTTAAAQGVNFDLMGTGTSAQWGWAAQGTGLLVMDRNHDGVINDGTELFGVATQTAAGTRAGNGFAALAQEDSNHDGIINAQDAHWKDLKVWVDANHDGKTDAGELKSLAELGIVSLNLDAKAGSAVDHGNLLGLVSSYTSADGSQHAMDDVWLARHPAPPPLNEVLAAPGGALMAAEPARPAPPQDTSAAGPQALLHPHPLADADPRLRELLL
jgi:hypothetical protein